MRCRNCQLAYPVSAEGPHACPACGAAPEREPMNSDVVEIDYTNWRGERSVRVIVPTRLWFGSNEWHPRPQWLLDAEDVEKGAERTFAMQGIHNWTKARDAR